MGSNYFIPELPEHALKTTMGGGDYNLSMEFDASSANYNDYVELKIKIGEENNPIPNLYGVAFSIKFNYPEVIKESSISVSYANSIFGQTNDFLKIVKPLLNPSKGRIDFALSRYDHLPLLDISGEVLTIRFIIEDNIDGFVSQTDYNLNAQFEDVVCVENWGNNIDLIQNQDNLTMTQTNSIWNPSISDDGVNFYPNPVKDLLHIELKDQSTIQKIKAYNSLGQIIFESYEDVKEISTKDWNEGIFLLEIWDYKDQKHLIKVLKQ